VTDAHGSWDCQASDGSREAAEIAKSCDGAAVTCKMDVAMRLRAEVSYAEGM